MTLVVNIDNIQASGQKRLPGCNPVFKGDDGLWYMLSQRWQAGAGPYNTFVHRFNPLIAGTGTLVATVTVGDLADAVAAYGLDTSVVDEPFHNPLFSVLPGTNYVLSVGGATPSSANPVYYYILLWKINASGLFVVVGGSRMGPYSYTRTARQWWAAGISGLMTGNDPLLAAFYGTSVFGSHGKFLLVMPSINTLLSGPTAHDVDVSSYNLLSLAEAFGSTSGAKFGAPHSSYRALESLGWFVPADEGDKTRFYFYVGKGDAQAHIDNFGIQDTYYIDPLAASYPNGWIAYIDLRGVSFNLLSIPATPGAAVVDSVNFLGEDGATVVMPFPDVSLNADGFTTTDTKGRGDYDPCPTVHKDGDGNIFVAFSQLLVDETTDMLGALDSYMRFRVFQLDYTNNQHVQKSHGVATNIFDKVSDFADLDSDVYHSFASKLGMNLNLDDYVIGGTASHATIGIDRTFLGQIDVESEEFLLNLSQSIGEFEFEGAVALGTCPIPGRAVDPCVPGRASGPIHMVCGRPSVESHCD